MATIYDTNSKQVVTVTLITDGQDFIPEAIMDYYPEAESEEVPFGADFSMSGSELEDLIGWAEREQDILDRANEIGEEAIEGIAKLAAEYGHDRHVLQDMEETFLGIRG